MGLLTFGLNVTLDGCIDHTQGIVDDELHDYWTQLMDRSGAMLFGRNTYELMEGVKVETSSDKRHLEARCPNHSSASEIS
jgi:hypothetical protein